MRRRAGRAAIMTTVLLPELEAQLREAAQREPTLELPFIVILAPGARAALALPFVPQTEVEAIRMVAGRMSAAQALALARVPGVESIEFDGTAQALAARPARR